MPSVPRPSPKSPGVAPHSRSPRMEAVLPSSPQTPHGGRCHKQTWHHHSRHRCAFFISLDLFHDRKREGGKKKIPNFYFFFLLRWGHQRQGGGSADAASGFPGLRSPALVTGLMTHGKGGGKRRVHGAVMFVNLKKAMCRQAACSGQEHRLPAARRGCGRQRGALGQQGQAAAASARASPGKVQPHSSATTPLSGTARSATGLNAGALNARALNATALIVTAPIATPSRGFQGSLKPHALVFLSLLLQPTAFWHGTHTGPRLTVPSSTWGARSRSGQRGGRATSSQHCSQRAGAEPSRHYTASPGLHADDCSN